MKDFFGNELAVGDIVAQAYTGYNALHKALIVSISKSSIVTKPCNDKGELTKRASRNVRDPKSCIKVPTLIDK